MLYQEWFVRLRYPGHEHDRVLGGVPEGWRRCPLSDVASVAMPKPVRVPPELVARGQKGGLALESVR